MDQPNQHLEDELLQRHFDGDLRGTRAAEVTRHLQQCNECSARHRALSTLHRMVEIAADDSARGVDFDALYARIERGIEQPRTLGLAERLSVWWRDLLEQKPGQVWVPAAAALGAAVIAVVVLQDDPAPAPRAEGAPVEQPAEEALADRGPDLHPAPAPVAHGTAPLNSEIVQVDFGSHPGTVFEIALADGTSTPVVWINEDM